MPWWSCNCWPSSGIPRRPSAGLVDFISRHPALAEETLRRCNRLKFLGHGPVTDIFEAVSRLGCYELYRIVSSPLAAQGIMHEASAQAAEELDWNIRF
jgi:HD-like signal output (HDOD) protein